MHATTARHRALSDDRRARIVEELHGAAAGLDASELAGRLGLHPNTVRWHLGILADAGLVSSAPAAHTTRGRPRILYSLTPEPKRHDRDEHRLLAAILTSALADGGEAAARAEDAGAAWGRHLLARGPLERRPSPETAVAQVAQLLDEQGFEPTVEGRAIHMHRCPFHDLAESQPEVVCGVHKGLIAGALAARGGDLEVGGLDVFVRPNLCVARLVQR